MPSVTSIAYWFYIAVICELIYRFFKRQPKNAIENEQYGDETATPNEVAKVEAQSEINNPVRSLKIKRRCPLSKEVSGLAENPFQKKTSQLGSPAGVSNGNEPLWQEDPYIKNGLSRVDRVSDDGKTSITTYYNDTGKLVYQKEKFISEKNEVPNISSSAAEEILGDNSFKIKPRMPPTEPIKKTVETITDFHNQIDKQFNDLFNDVTKAIPKVTKSVVDEHVDSAFDEIFNSLHAGSF